MSGDGTKDDVIIPVDWETHKQNNLPMLSGYNTLVKTKQVSERSHDRKIVEELAGKTIAEALRMGLMVSGGGTTKCTLTLIKYLLDQKLLKSIPPKKETMQDQARPICTKGKDEEQGEDEAIREMTSGVRYPRTRRGRAEAKKRGLVSQIMTAAVMCQILTASIFDEQFAPKEELADILQRTRPLVHMPEVVVNQIRRETDNCHEGLRTVDGRILDESDQSFYTLRDIERATKEELTTSSGGTYKDNEGNIHLGYNIRRVLSYHTQDVQEIVKEAVDFVWELPDYDMRQRIQTTMEGQETIEVVAPTGSRKAMSDDTHLMWTQSTISEINGLYEMDCIEYVKLDDPRLIGATILPSHVVYVAKFTSDVPAKFIKAKARLVADGNFEPRPEIPFANFSPTAGPCLNRLCDAYAVMNGYHIWTTDCTQAFLNSKTDTDIFIRPPPGCGRKGYVWRLKKYLYGLKSSPAKWMETLTDELRRHGFVPFDDDPCLLRLKKGTGAEVIACVFVDDVKWACRDEETLKDIISKIGDVFQLTVGKTPVNSQSKHKINWEDAKITTYLGMRYNHDMAVDGQHRLVVDQTAYIDKLTERFEMEDAKDAFTPLPCMATPGQLKDRMGKTDDQELQQWADKFTFPVIVGSLIHAMVHTRPD